MILSNNFFLFQALWSLEVGKKASTHPGDDHEQETRKSHNHHRYH